MVKIDIFGSKFPLGSGRVEWGTEKITIFALKFISHHFKTPKIFGKNWQFLYLKFPLGPARVGYEKNHNFCLKTHFWPFLTKYFVLQLTIFFCQKFHWGGAGWSGVLTKSKFLHKSSFQIILRLKIFLVKIDIFGKKSPGWGGVTKNLNLFIKTHLEQFQNEKQKWGKKLNVILDQDWSCSRLTWIQKDPGRSKPEDRSG